MAGVLVVFAMVQRAYPEAVVVTDVAAATALGDEHLVNRVTKADFVSNMGSWQKLSARAAFGRLWIAERSEPVQARPKLASAQPMVFFASADTVEDMSAPFKALFADPSADESPGWRDGALPEAARSEGEIKCLAQAIYFEARGESRTGQLAVAQVIMNRVKSPLYPKTICGVVYQGQNDANRCQFSFACDGIPDRIADNSAWRRALDLARKVAVYGDEMYLAEVGNSTHYHALYASPIWARNMRETDTIGHHVFYAPRGRTAS